MRRLVELSLIVICITGTLVLSYHSERTNRAMARGEFEKLTDATFAALTDRMNTYVQSLNASAAYFNSSNKVTVEEFDNYVDKLNIAEFLPGINGIGFIEPFAKADEPLFLEQIAEMGLPDFRIHPETEGPERFVVTRISPLAPNKEALGLDISFEVGRRTAAMLSRETGTPQLTPRILLVQDSTKEPGFLLLRPLYWDESMIDGGDHPTTGFRGWVYAPFIGNNLLQNLTASAGDRFHFSVFDGRTTDPEATIYASNKTGELAGTYTAQYEVDKYGRIWTVAFASTPGFERGFGNVIPYAILIVGLFVSGLLTFALRNLNGRNQALSDLAALRTREIGARERENRAVIENAVIGVLILDVDENVLFANQAAQKCFGYPRTEMEELCFADFVMPLEIPSEDYNARGLTRQGQELVLDLQRNEWRTSEGDRRVTAIIRDVTKEQAARSEILNTKASYDLALKGAQIGVFDVDLLKGTSDVSDTWCDLMGLPRDSRENAQEIFLSRIHPEDLHLIEKADADCIQGITQRSISEYRMAFARNEWRWMRSDAVIVERDASGEALRMIGTQTDVTDLRHARNALEASEQRFRQVLASAPIGMALIRDDGRFAIVNKAFCTLVGHSEEVLTGDKTMRDMLMPDDSRTMYFAVQAMLKDPTVSVYTGEHRLRLASGEERWGLFNISWTFDKNLNGNVFIAQINDITDKRKLEQIKNEFVSTVSHELRTPLTSIKGALSLITASGKDDMTPGSKRLIEIALSNTDRLASIVNDILDLEKISSGDIAFTFDAENMGELIEQSVLELEPFAITHKTKLSIELPEDPIWVWADFGRTKQVLVNLLSNACKYSDDGSTAVIRAEVLEDKAIVYVQNQGPGIPESFRPKMFGAFSQADASDTRAKGGTGLGLNITKQIVSRHDGSIGYESTPNGVTVFWFTYPLAPADSIPIGAAAPASEGAEANNLSILHLEDDEDFAEVISSGLSRISEITHVKTLAKTREALAEKKFDLIILDWAVPDGDAHSLLDEIYSKDPSARIIGLSADADLRSDSRLFANLVKSRTELEMISNYVLGSRAKVS